MTILEIIREILENRAQTYRQLGEEHDVSHVTDKRLRKSEDNLEEGGTDSNFINYKSSAMKNYETI